MMRRRAANADSVSDGSKSPRKKAAPAPTAMVSNVQVFAVVLFFLFAGILQEHYRSSRSKDPLLPDHQHLQRLMQSSRNRASVPQTSLLSPEDDAALERDEDGIRYHVIFSTDCSPYQHWQSFLVFYTAMKVKQPGHVTRIASGCDGEQETEMKTWFERDVSFMSTRFHLQLTPHFSDIKNDKGETIGDYKFFNKPYGLRYWMENSPQLSYNKITGEFPDEEHDDIIILIDPDMGLMRPITADFSSERETVISKARRNHLVAHKVSQGKPFAQTYGFQAQWERLDLAKIAGDGTPAAKVSPEDGLLYYPVGPPYLATLVDMYKIAQKWCQFVPGTHEQYPYLLAEMFAFCIAAAHLELPHQLVNSLMVSDTQSASTEGWELIDKIPAEEVCEFGKNIDHSKYAVPSVVHLCQRYSMGEDWFFGKRAVPSDIYDCEVPLFEEPPDDLAVKYDYKIPPNGKRQDLDAKHVKRETYMLCFITRIVNEAATFYKQNSCEPGSINLDKKRNLAEYMREKAKQKHAARAQST